MRYVFSSRFSSAGISSTWLVRLTSIGIAFLLVACGSGQEAEPPSETLSPSSIATEPSASPSSAPIDTQALQAIEDDFLASYPAISAEGTGLQAQLAAMRKLLTKGAAAYQAMADGMEAFTLPDGSSPTGFKEAAASLRKLAEKDLKASKKSDLVMSIRGFTSTYFEGQCVVADAARAIESAGGPSLGEFTSRIQTKEFFFGFEDAQSMCDLPFKKGFPRFVAMNQVNSVAPSWFEAWLLESSVPEGQNALLAISPTLYVPWDVYTAPWTYLRIGPWHGKCGDYFAWSKEIGHAPIGDDGSCW